MKEKNETCVELNIYVECEKCSHSDSCTETVNTDKCEDNDSCIKINVFVDCGKKKCRYTL